MKKILILSFLITLLLIPQAVRAEGVANNSEVDWVRVDLDGRGIVYFLSPLQNTPAACGSQYPNALAFDANTPGGQAIMKLALSAKLGDYKIYARGTGSCGIYSVIESWIWGRLDD